MSLFSFASTILRRSASLQYPLQCINCVNQIRSIPSRSLATKPTNCVNQIRSIPSRSLAIKTLHDVNTNVIKDVILFKYENPKFYMYMNVFAIVQYMFWTYLGIFAFSTLRDAPVDKTKITDDTPWFRKINLGENKYRNTIGSLAIVIGMGSLAMIWMYTLRSVRFLILNKGGNHITLVTYAPFGKNRMMTVPLENVCCKESRTGARVQLPLKVKNKMMHFMLDMRGEFKNGKLFDATAGLARKL